MMLLHPIRMLIQKCDTRVEGIAEQLDQYLNAAVSRLQQKVLMATLLKLLLVRMVKQELLLMMSSTVAVELFLRWSVVSVSVLIPD